MMAARAASVTLACTLLVCALTPGCLLDQPRVSSAQVEEWNQLADSTMPGLDVEVSYESDSNMFGASEPTAVEVTARFDQFTAVEENSAALSELQHTIELEAPDVETQIVLEYVNEG